MIKHFISNNIEKYEIPRLQGRVKGLLNSKQHETKILKSNFNGYGYEDTTYKYILNNDDYNEIKLFIENKNKQKKDRKELTEEKKIEKWSERLSNLTGISLDEAKKIAYEKIEYKENRYIKMIDNYNENPSKKNYQLANKIKNSNPLRYIKDKEHAENILIASKRHNNSNYEELIEEGKEMAKHGEIEYSQIKDYARSNYSYNEEEFDKYIESMQVNNGISETSLEKMYENEMNFNERPDYLDSEGNPHWYNEDDEDDEDIYFNEDDEDNEDIYFKLADKICQAAYEDSASGFYTELDFEEISKIANKDIDWVKVHIEKIGEALIEHNDELLLEFNPDKNINKENNTIEFNFCSVGEDANELFKYENNRWIRKTDKELENEGLLKPTVEVFKESFESFIQTIPFVANDSIKNDLKQIKANALYVYHSSSEEYAIISRRENDKTFMVHKYYPSNENGGLHQGAYDISTFETAEQNAIRRIVDLSEVNYELKKWVAGTREEEFNRILKNDLSSVIEYINEYVAKEDEKIELVDVKTYEYGESNNKIKVLVEYNGNFREDDFFNILNEEDEELGLRTINGCVIDFNPINPEKSGTISEYLEMLKNIENKNNDSKQENYKKERLHKKENESSKEFTLEDLKEKYKEKDKEYTELLHQQFRAENKNEDTSKIKEKISNIRNELKKIESDIKKEENKEEEKLDKIENNFSLKDIGSDKKVKTLKQFEAVVIQLATEKDQSKAEEQYYDFLAYNIEGDMLGRLYDRIFEKYGETPYSTLKKQIKKEIETKNKNSNIESTLENYKEKAIDICSKDNPTLKLTMFIKDLVKDLSNEEKLNLFKQVNETISQEINNLQENCNQTENNKTNSNKGKGR